MAANLTHITDKTTTPNVEYKFTPESTAEEFSTSKAYAVGDYCFYNGELYKCKEEKTAGAWAAEKFKKANLGGDVSALKSDFANVTEGYQDGTESHTLDITWSTGYMATDGSIGSSDTLRYSNKISVVEGDILSSTKSFRFVTAFNGNTAVAAKGDATGSLFSYTVPSGIDGVVITNYVAENADVVKTSAVIIHSAKDVKARESISDIESIFNIEEKTFNKRIYPSINWTSGYMGTDGSTGAVSTLLYSNAFDVEPGDVLTLDAGTFRFVTAFNASNQAVPAKGDSTGTLISYTVPTDIVKVVVTIYTQYQSAPYIVRSNVIEEIEQQSVFGRFHVKSNLSNGETLLLPQQNVNKATVMAFSGDITSFSSMTIGKRYDLSHGFWAVIDETNLTVYQNNTQYTQDAHGLTIQNDIQVKIITETGCTENPSEYAYANVVITSNGEQFSKRISYWGSTSVYGRPFVASSGSTLTDCSFSFQVCDANKLIYAFGDSYFSWYPQRWVYYLGADGYAENIMMNAYAGEASGDAYVALNNLLRIGKPHYIFWCLGMNDASDSSDAPSTGWMNGVNKVLDLCEQYGITPVFATIPTVPTINNEQKNAWVRSSGYRYVDFAKAVGAQSNGTWYSGMLDDGVHPSVTGAKALYGRLLADFPEVMISN